MKIRNWILFRASQSSSRKRATANELAAALTDADQLRATYRAKREAYHQSTTLLHNVQQTTTALESHLRSILIAIKNLSPQAIQTLTTSYTEQIQVLQAQLCNIDISSIETVTTSIDSFSTSIQALQEEINSQLGNITIDQESLQQSIQDQSNKQ
jgi:chromosome segregation ATPase